MNGRMATMGIGLVAILTANAGCGGATSSNNGSPSTGNVVTSNPQTPVPWATLANRSNISATMRVNDSGTTVTEIPANVINASVTSVTLAGRVETNVEDLYCMPANGRGVYEGDSGSPVLVSGDVAGGLFGSADGKHFDARGIEQMEVTANGPPVARKSTNRKPVRWHIRGPAALMPLLHARPGFGNAVYEGTINRYALPQTGGGTAALIPGLRFASPFVNGTYVIGYDMATYTFELSGGNWVATAHGLEDAGQVSWPVMGVSVIGPNADGTIHANPVGSVYGTLLYDGENGSLINPSVAAQTMSVTVYVTYNGLPQPTSYNQVRFDLGSSTEDTGIETAAQSTVQAQLQGKGSGFGGTGSIQYTTSGSGGGTFTMSFANGESLSALVSNIGSQLDTILTSAQSSDPSGQIQTANINLVITG